MKIEITVYGHKVKEEHEKFSFDFILPCKYSLDDIKDKYGFVRMLNKEISSRLKYDFIILDYDVMCYFEASNEKL